MTQPVKGHLLLGKYRFSPPTPLKEGGAGGSALFEGIQGKELFHLSRFSSPQLNLRWLIYIWPGAVRRPRPANYNEDILSKPFEVSPNMSMSMEVKLKIPVLIMFLHMTSSSSSLTLPRLSRSAVRCCNGLLYFFTSLTGIIKFPMRLFEPLLF